MVHPSRALSRLTATAQCNSSLMMPTRTIILCKPLSRGAGVRVTSRPPTRSLGPRMPPPAEILHSILHSTTSRLSPLLVDSPILIADTASWLAIGTICHFSKMRLEQKAPCWDAGQLPASQLSSPAPHSRLSIPAQDQLSSAQVLLPPSPPVSLAPSPMA